jgi:hypothetical protein
MELELREGMPYLTNGANLGGIRPRHFPERVIIEAEGSTGQARPGEIVAGQILEKALRREGQRTVPGEAFGIVRHEICSTGEQSRVRPLRSAIFAA